MQIPNNICDVLIDHQAFRVCPLLSASRFLRFCEDRGLSVNAQRLRKLERLRLFLPIMRVYKPDVQSKVEYVDGGARYRDLGPVQDGEQWDGDTITEIAQFSFGRKYIESWRDEGLVWDPRTTTSPHAESIDIDAARHEAYYSRFQIEQLRLLLSGLTLHTSMEFAVEDDGVTAATPEGDIKEWILDHVRALVVQRDNVAYRDVLGPLCQFISDKYYPKTQTDERKFTLSTGDMLDFGRWDWYDYCAKWDAQAVISSFDLSDVELRRIYTAFAGGQNRSNPLADWHSLFRFISVEKRSRLRGSAQLGMTLWEMAEMLRMLFRDAFGETLPEVYDVSRTIIHRIPDISPGDDPLRALELVVNDFGVNPKPKLVMFVEGQTEATVLPIALDRLFGAGPSVFGIEIVNLRGVSNAAGGKENPFSTLWRLIDYLHHHQTIAVVLVDNEGFAAKNIRHGLPQAISTYFADRRATRPEYVKVWRLSFELDNFSDGEIAETLSDFGKTEFSRDDVAVCRQHARHPPKTGKQQTVEKLFLARTGVTLNKPQFGLALLEKMFASASRKLEYRPLVRFLDRVTKLAARNHQPTTQAMWEYNQRTGYLGTLKPGAVGRRARPFQKPRQSRENKSRANPGGRSTLS